MRRMLVMHSYRLVATLADGREYQVVRTVSARELMLATFNLRTFTHQSAKRELDAALAAEGCKAVDYRDEWTPIYVYEE